MVDPKEKKMVFFGCALDCDEKDESIREKLMFNRTSDESDDPYDHVMALLRSEISEELRAEAGSIGIPEWLRPMPSQEDSSRIVVDEFVAFMDQDGCRTLASEVEVLVKQRILPNIPCMIAVDHALTGGVFCSLAEVYGKEDLSLIILDSHTDAIPMSIIADAIQYDLDTNPNSVYEKDDPFLYNRPDSYNASSFVYHLLEQGDVLPENLAIIGVSDYPQKRALRIKDPRIVKYTKSYTDLKRRGVKLITKNECLVSPSKLKKLLQKLDTPYVYISIDMDVGARNAVDGVRFRNWQGLQEKQLYRIADALCDLQNRDIELAGMDVTEFNTRRAGTKAAAGDDRTYRVAANLIKMIGFGMPETM